MDLTPPVDPFPGVEGVGPLDSMGPVERELKLVPSDPSLLDALERVDTLGSFRATGYRRERQRNAYFETREGALGTARLAFRRRVVEGASLAVWTLKGEGATLHGVAARPEVDVMLDADTPPILALSMLRQAARERGSAGLADVLADALNGASPPLAAPLVELAADRRIVDLVDADRGWAVELALDRVHVVGVPGARYLDVEIEVELKRGDLAALEAAGEAISKRGEVRHSVGTKLSRALAYRAQQGALPSQP